MPMQQVFGHLAVDERVAIHQEELLQHPKPKQPIPRPAPGPRSESVLSSHADFEGAAPEVARLTLMVGFHTIR